MSDLPKGWTIVAFPELFQDVSRLAGKLPTRELAQDGQFPVVDQGEVAISGWTNDKSRVYRGDLPVILFGDHTKTLKYQGVPFVAGADGLKVLRPSEKIDPRYAFHALKLARFPDAGYSRHFKFLKAAWIPLPPLNEQRRIATILDKIAELIALRYESSNRVDRSVEMAFRAHFSGSNMQPLGEAAQLFSGGTLPTGEAFRGQADGNLLVKVSDMNRPGNERVINTTASWTASSGPKSSTAPAHSVILPKRGGAISTNKKRLLNRPGILDPNLMGVSPDSSTLLPEVLYTWFQTFDLSSVTSGSTVPQLNKKDLIGLKVPATSIRHQTEFARLHRHADAIRHRLQDSLTGLLGLQNSLESRAFQGNL